MQSYFFWFLFSAEVIPYTLCFIRYKTTAEFNLKYFFLIINQLPDFFILPRGNCTMLF